MNNRIGFGTNLNQAQAVQPFTFHDCVRKIKEIYEAETVLDNMTKLNVIKQHITKYFETEEPADVFEGFVHLVNYLDRITTTISNQLDLSLVKLALESYNEFFDKYPALSRKETHDEDLLFGALQNLSKLKLKHTEKIAKVFHLLEASPILAKKLINWILTTEDLPKAVKWMEVLNARDAFPFEQIAIRLIADNEIGVLDIFVGKEQYRGQKMVNYLDKLVECHWKDRAGMNELENRMIGEHKRLMRLATRYARNFGLNHNEIPNVKNVQAYDELLYHYFSWKNRERSCDHFEEVALPLLIDFPEIRDRYFNFLCDQGYEYANKALHFAQLLHIPEANYPNKLVQFMRQNPANFSIIQDKISRNKKIEKQNVKIEQESDCRLDDGKPILLVDNLDTFHQVIAILLSGDEKIVGVDSEWRSNFLSNTERLSLLQIALSNIVYLVDVLWLEEKLKIPEVVWMNFFEALFCTEGVQKLGYDFRNDIRVIKSTFPFVTKILPLAKEVICMYKLLQQVVLMQDASRTVFGPRPPRNMGLSDMAYYFLKINLPKNEREGNWSQRPLRLEQKKYAALDADCLVKIYGIIEPKIKTLIQEQQMALRKCAIINFVADEEKPRLAPCMLADGDGQVVGKNKETEDVFIMNIQKTSADLLSKASNSQNSIRSVNDVRFVVDSMLFGLGKNLRKCGFDTQLIGDRDKIINFCQQNSNEDYIVLSTGKGHTRLESILGANRCFHVPVSTHTGAIQSSLQVNHIMRELNIAIRPEDMWCRCMECNQRVFVPMPSQIVQVIFFMNAVRINAEWLDITEEDMQNSLKKLRDDSELTLGIMPEMHTGKQPRQDRRELAEGAYYLYQDTNNLVCETSHFTVDIINKLMHFDNGGASCSIQVGLKYTKAIFDNHQNQFIVCTQCGKVQLKGITSEE